MSEHHKHNDCPPEAKPTPARITAWAVFFALLMLLFVTVSFVTLVLPRPRTLSESAAAHRRELVGDIKQKQLAQLNSYGWVDEKNHVAHIPIDIAMQKFVDQAQAAPAVPQEEKR